MSVRRACCPGPEAQKTKLATRKTEVLEAWKGITNFTLPDAEEEAAHGHDGRRDFRCLVVVSVEGQGCGGVMERRAQRRRATTGVVIHVGTQRPGGQGGMVPSFGRVAGR